jgi:hypothetical protein
MRVRCGLTCILAMVAVQFGSANVPVQQSAGGRGEFIDRFLAPNEPPLVSYRAFRRLTASTRGGHLRAAIEAWTTLDPVQGFSFEITSEEGSAIIRRKVLIAALQAEQMAVGKSDRAQSALTPANYEFLGISPESDRLVKMDVRPRRKHVMLVHGALFIEADSADLVRVEGELSQRPSIWTRRVHVVREYDRVAGVHVPVSMRSTADVLLVGSSSFAMTYRYVEINGKPVTPITNETKDK